jgi:hypothetical protein
MSQVQAASRSSLQQESISVASRSNAVRKEETIC